MSNEYLKRGEGKNIANVKKYEFYSHYRKHSKLKKLERTQYSAFVKDLMIAYSTAIVAENMQIKFGKLGYIRVQAKQLNFVKQNGELSKTLKVDWYKTWVYWEKKYEGKTRDEIIEIENKKVLYFENNHTNQEFYKHLWDNTTAIIKFKRFYKFKPSRQYSRLITKIVSDPNRKIFYYG
jgi:hypothetical protein